MLMGTLAYPFEAQEADTRKQKLTQTEFLDTRDIDCIEQPGLNARARFFARRHCLIVHVIVSALLAFPIALVVVMRARQIDDVVDYLIVTQFGLCSMLGFMAFWPLLSSMNWPAKPVDFAAAFAAADEHERPHLRHKIEQRLSSRIQPEPLTVQDLALAFSIVRSEHGKQARRAAEKATKARAAQREFLGRKEAR